MEKCTQAHFPKFTELVWMLEHGLQAQFHLIPKPALSLHHLTSGVDLCLDSYGIILEKDT